jgi:hypothetical protein
MPDADDFDVEELRRLLNGGGEKAGPEAPAPPEKPRAPRAAKKPAAGGNKKPKPRRRP